MIEAIVAYDMNRAIGSGNYLPWKSREDMRYFKRMTEGNVVIMGFNTWGSLIDLPLKGRDNIVLTRNIRHIRAIHDVGGLVAHDIAIAARMGELLSEGRRCFVIGGSSIYHQMMPLTQQIHVTEFQGVVGGCESFFPRLEGDWTKETAFAGFMFDKDVDMHYQQYTLLRKE